MTRRELLKASLVASAALPLACATPQKAAGPPAPSTGLPRRTLGKTGAAVTILGLGGAWIAHRPDVNPRSTVEAALDCGIRYFDTAANYSGSEEHLGPLLAGVRREVFLVTKLDHLLGKDAEVGLHQSLKRLKTGHVDLLLLHGVGCAGGWDDPEKILSRDGALAYLRKAKRQGLTRFIGMSAHPPYGAAMKILDHADDLDVAMPFVNALAVAGPEGSGGFIARCRERGMGLAAMKVLGGDGQLAKDYDGAFRYTLSIPGVACAVVGARSDTEVRRAARAAMELRPLSDAEMRDAALAGARLTRSLATEYIQLRSHFAGDMGIV